MNQTLKKTATRVKFSGMTFIHNSKCVEGNNEPKEYLILNGIRYYKIKNEASVDSIPDSFNLDVTIDLPDDNEIELIESKGSLVISEKGELEDMTEKPKIKYHPNHPGKKMKARYLNPKNGNYVSYVRAIQLKLIGKA